MKGGGMRFLKVFLLAFVLILAVWVQAEQKDVPAPTQDEIYAMNLYKGYAGSRSCIDCHEKFYKLWSSSLHGLSFQPYSAAFAKAKLTAQASEIAIGKYRYRADVSDGAGWVIEKGPDGEKKYPMEQVVGGKYVYYFLTTLERGKLQTLPVAYDVHKKEWFDTAASGIRHFPDAQRTDSPVFWKDQAYTFNTACFGCHVSQMSTKYDLKTDTYKTAWKEPGINCETCHGPSEEHNRVCEEAGEGNVPADLKIISVKKFTVAQHNDSCGSCHAKAVVLTNNFKPGERFFDHFDLATLEDHDFYPDGRDLGENYTHTTWLMSPCVQSGKLSCVHCHTSSGRYRFKADDKANNACLPCHKERVENAAAHTNHPPGTPASKCIACHMPKTEFARMKRSDHSLLPPTPAVTLAYKSPNACNVCHTDKDAKWADENVRKWRKRDYQAPVLYRTGLIDDARKGNWSRLTEMLQYLDKKQPGDEVVATSLIRLLRNCDDPRKNPVLLKMMQDRSPLVRSAAADALSFYPTRGNLQALVRATGDEYRVVRIRAAAGLTGMKGLVLSEADKKNIEKANREYLQSIAIPPDHWASYFNLGNYYLNLGDFRQAVTSYETSLKIDPQRVMTQVNLSMAYANLGERKKVESSLKEALKIEPDSAAANFNMGLLKADQGDRKGAERYLRRAWKADPKMGQAAYNLCDILSESKPDEAVGWCRKAAEASPSNPKFAYSLALLELKKGDTEAAIGTLRKLIARNPDYPDAYVLLGEIYERQGRVNEARTVYQQALWNPDIPAQSRTYIEQRIRALSGRR
jgi:tetratricopeptide (TPR) repeat protein/cytochrome c556